MIKLLINLEDMLYTVLGFHTVSVRFIQHKHCMEMAFKELTMS